MSDVVCNHAEDCKADPDWCEHVTGHSWIDGCHRDHCAHVNDDVFCVTHQSTDDDTEKKLDTITHCPNCGYDLTEVPDAAT